MNNILNELYSMAYLINEKKGEINLKNFISSFEKEDNSRPKLLSQEEIIENGICAFFSEEIFNSVVFTYEKLKNLDIKKENVEFGEFDKFIVSKDLYFWANKNKEDFLDFLYTLLELVNKEKAVYFLEKAKVEKDIKVDLLALKILFEFYQS